VFCIDKKYYPQHLETGLQRDDTLLTIDSYRIYMIKHNQSISLNLVLRHCSVEFVYSAAMLQQLDWCDWQDGPSSLTDDEVMILVESKHIPAYQLEKQLDNHQRGVAIRSHMMSYIVCPSSSCVASTTRGA